MLQWENTSLACQRPWAQASVPQTRETTTKTERKKEKTPLASTSGNIILKLRPLAEAAH